MTDKTSSARPSVAYSYARSTQLEGTYPEDAGCHVVTSMRVAAGWGSVDDRAWPFDASEGWVPEEPNGLDQLAKASRAPCYVRVRSVEECIRATASVWPPFVALGTTRDWDDAPRGSIPTPEAGASIDGAHCVCVTGHDARRRRIVFVNSWGESWGNGGFGSISFDYFDRFMQEAWIHAPLCNLRELPQYQVGLPSLNWGMRTPVGVVHGVEIYDRSEDSRAAWAFAREDESPFLEIEEVFVRPEQRGTGMGRQLCDGLLELSVKLSKPLRLWVPAIDDDMSAGASEAVASRLLLELRPSPVPWASRVGILPAAWDMVGCPDPPDSMPQ